MRYYYITPQNYVSLYSIIYVPMGVCYCVSLCSMSYFMASVTVSSTVHLEFLARSDVSKKNVSYVSFCGISDGILSETSSDRKVQV